MEPKLRIKGFDEDWEKSCIGNVADVVGGGTPSTMVPGYWDGKIQWFTPSEIGKCKYVTKSARTITTLGLENSSAKMLPANSILLSSRATIGEASICETECCTNQGFQSLIPKNTDLEFLFSLIGTKKDDLIRESSGSTFLEISGKKVRGIAIDIPCLDEQKEIGKYFLNLDRTISATDARIASLKQMKAASLQAMFPQEGETVPKVRFKGFDGEWKKVKVGECGTWTKGRLLSKSDLVSEGQYKCIHYGELFVLYNEVIRNVYSKTNLDNGVFSSVGDILFPDSDVTPTGLARCSSIMEEGVVLGGGINILHTNKKLYAPCVSYSINIEKKQIMSRVTGTTVRHINSKALSEVEIMLPVDYNEQQMIADCLTNLDVQINLQTQRLEKLKNIKSACLDSMFV